MSLASIGLTACAAFCLMTESGCLSGAFLVAQLT